MVTHGNNGLENGLRWMLTRLMQAAAGQKLRSADGVWDRTEVKRYLRCGKRFKEVLLVANHIMAGEPGRGTVITTLRHRNGALQDRNVLVLDGQVMTVVRYYKSQSQWDKPKAIPRFLPSRLSQVVVVYLAYLQPFEKYLTVQVLGSSFSDYMWANEQGPWTTEQLTRVLKRETGKHLGVPLNTSSNIRMAPVLSATSRRKCRNAFVAALQPPNPWTGSTRTAARESCVSSSKIAVVSRMLL